MPLQEVGASNGRALQDIADSIAKSHKILVVTGAGISTNCGIPDFRSKDGLYNMIPAQTILPTPPASRTSTPSRKRKAADLDDDDDEAPSSQSSCSSKRSRLSNSPASRMKGEDLFHARVFQSSETAKVFYQFIASLRQKIKDDVKDTSATHKFIRTLRDAGRLMRCYTQNIDGLEQREGLSMDLARGKGNKRRFMKKYFELPRPEQTQGTDFDGGCEVVQLHGELTNLRCTMCSTEEEWTYEATGILLEGFAPKCDQCAEKSELRQATGKRGLTVGAMRPNIVLYGEEHPQNTLLSPLVPYDISSSPDVLIIMGTSLKVHGLQKIIRDFAKAVHGQKNGRIIFVNKTRPAESVWDGVIDDFVAMDCDEWVRDLKVRREDLWQRQGEIVLKQTKSSVPKRKRKSEEISKDIRETPSKKCQSRKGQELVVNVPRWDHDKQQPVTEEKENQQKNSNSKSPATIWRGRRKVSKAHTGLSSISQTRSNVRPGRPESGTSDTPRRPVPSPITPAFTPTTPACYSPITPAFSPWTMTSRSPGRGVISHTPSRLRIMMDAEMLDDNDDDNDAEEADLSTIQIFDDSTINSNGTQTSSQGANENKPDPDDQEIIEHILRSHSKPRPSLTQSLLRRGSAPPTNKPKSCVTAVTAGRSTATTKGGYEFKSTKFLLGRLLASSIMGLSSSSSSSSMRY